MKVHPLIAAAAILLAGVIAFGASAVVQHRRARARRPPPVPELDEAPPAPRQAASVVEAPRPRWRPPAPAPAPKVELHVHVAGPHGITPEEVSVLVHRRAAEADDWDLLDAQHDEADEADEAEGVQGMYASTDLAPGRYDLKVEASGMRTIHLDDVATGVKVIEVALARAPALLGAIGALGEPGCAGVTVRWTSPGQADNDDDDGESGEATVNEEACTFVADTFPDTGTVTVVAERGNRRDSALVTPPLSGNPSFLCLAPPCAGQPASLLVYLADTNHHEVDDAMLTWTLQADELHGEMGTWTGGSHLFLNTRRVGQTVTLRADHGKHFVETTVALGPGVNEVVLTLPAAPPEADAEPEAEPEVEGERGIELKRVIIRR